MLDPKIIEEIIKNISDKMPKSLQNLQADLEMALRDGIQSTFAKLDLVTREEFDTQIKVLARTRAKIEALEAQLHSLEQTINSKKTP